MKNLMPDRYRQVAITEVDFELSPRSIEAFFLGREAYRRTRYIVVVADDEIALIQVEKASEEPLFSPITRVEIIGAPGECALIRDAETDTGIASHLAIAAQRQAPDKRCVAVIGRYEHLSFIADPEPVEIVVRDVVPPHPAKLADQAQRIIDVSEDLPPIVLVPDVVDLDDLVDEASEYLLPCAGAATDDGRGNLSYLDQRPDYRDWTLVGCTRSQQIHTWFYGREAPARDFCPRRRAADDGQVVLTKCCLLESGMEVRGTVVYLPWGSTLQGVREGLGAAIALSRALSRESTEASPGSSTDPQHAAVRD